MTSNTIVRQDPAFGVVRPSESADLLAEIARLREENARLRDDVRIMADRMAGTSWTLGRLAEKRKDV